MSAQSFRSSSPDRWTQPRQPMDPSERRLRYGRIQPMERPSLLARLLGRR